MTILLDKDLFLIVMFSFSNINDNKKNNNMYQAEVKIKRTIAQVNTDLDMCKYK